MPFSVLALRDPNVPHASDFVEACINIMLHDISRRGEGHKKAIYNVQKVNGVKWSGGGLKLDRSNIDCLTLLKVWRLKG